MKRLILALAAILVVSTAALARHSVIPPSQLRQIESQTDRCKATAKKLERTTTGLVKLYEMVEKMMDNWKKRSGKITEIEKKTFERQMDKVLRDTRSAQRDFERMLECGKKLETMSDKVTR